MTREEFNKLSQQEKLNLVGEKWYSLYNKNSEYGITIERAYVTDKYGGKHLHYETWYTKLELPFGKYFKDLNVYLGKDESGCFCVFYKRKEGTTYRIGTVPEEFLEEAYFFEFPKSSINEYIDEYSIDIFKPYVKKCTDYRSIDEICRSEKSCNDEDLHNNKTDIRESFWNDSSKITKTNIAIISVAVLITIGNVLCAIC